MGGVLGPLSTAYRLFQQFRAVDEMGQRITFLGRAAARAGPIVTRGFGLMRTAALFLARGVARAGMMLLANPVVLAITAIVLVIGGAAYLIWRHWDRIKGAFDAGRAMLGRAVGFVKSHAVAILPAFGPLGVVAALVIRNWSRISAAFGMGIRAVGDAVSGGLSFLRGFAANFIGVGRAIIDGLVSGIRAAPGKIWAALKSIIGGAWSNAKSFLGINSPSRLFMQMGGFVADGLAIGIDRGQRRPVDSARRLAQGVLGGFSLPRSPFAASPGGAGPAGAVASARPATAAGMSIRDIIFNLQQQPGENAEQFAKRVLKELRKLLERESRGSYADR